MEKKLHPQKLTRNLENDGFQKEYQFSGADFHVPCQTLGMYLVKDLISINTSKCFKTQQVATLSLEN